MPASAGTMPALLIQQKLGKVLQSLLNKPRFSKREESVFKDEYNFHFLSKVSHYKLCFQILAFGPSAVTARPQFVCPQCRPG